MLVEVKREDGNTIVQNAILPYVLAVD